MGYWSHIWERMKSNPLLGIADPFALTEKLFPKQKDPSEAAMPFLEKIPGMLQEQYGPYQQQGQDAYGQMNPVLNQMTSDPAAFLESLGKNYQQSPGYNFKRDEMLKAAGNSAASGGMAGSLSDIQNQGRLAEMLAGDDYQQWLQNAMGVQGMGLQGQQGLYNTGFNASSNMAGDLSNVLGSQSSLAFQGQANKNKSQADIAKALMTALGAVGGGIAGGPGGAMAGAKFGGQIGSQWM
jgi:hypothetical protein